MINTATPSKVYDANGNLVDNLTLSTANPETINSTSLQNVPSVNYATPTPVPVPTVSGLDTSVPQATLTQPETQANDLTTRLQQLNDSLLGKSSYQTQQETAQGIPELQKTQTELSSRLKALQNEALAIPLQIENQNIGRASTSEIQRQSTAALRTNAIQALSINSLLESSKGNIANAQALADKAVQAKFGPLEEEQKAKLANLDLILKSPAYSIADKNRAAQMQAQVNAQTAKLAEQKANHENAIAQANAASKLNPSDPQAQYAAQQVFKLDPTSPDYMQKVNALVGKYQTNPLEQDQAKATLALTWANVAKQKELGSLLSIKDAQALGVPYGTTKEQAIAQGKVPGVAAEAGTLKQNALESAKALLQKFQSGIGTSAVGGNLLNRFEAIGDFLGKGTGRADFLVQLNNMKSLLSLDNVKYLKGQGQVSDAERRLLEQASAKLDRTQSEEEFAKSLTEIITALSGTTTTTNSDEVTVISPDGTEGTIPKSQLSDALKEGYKQK